MQSTLTAFNTGINKSLTILAINKPTAIMIPAAISLGINPRNALTIPEIGADTLYKSNLSNAPGKNSKNTTK